MPPVSDEERYRDVLEVFGELRRDFQRFEHQARGEQLEYWKATAAAIRALTDWWVKATDNDRKERELRQAELDTWRASQVRRGRERFLIEVAILVGVVLMLIGWVFG